MTRKIAIRWMTGAASLVALLAGPSPGDASPGTLPAVGDTTPPSGSLLSWSHNATEYRGQVGRRISFTCSPGGSLASVWGTDVYSDDSSICTAAVHAGVISRDRGGAVTIEMRPGLGEYPASTRNGISTSRWGSWSGSYAFVGGLLSNPTIDWGTNAVLYRGQVGQQHSFTCPAGGTARTIWGTGLYTDDSSICTAAAHAGILTLGTGGPVTIEIRPGQTSYAAATRNGIASRGYGSWSGSYVIVGAPQPSGVRTPSTGRSWSGTITSSDQRRDDGSWYDVYPVHLQLGETVVITLNSSDFDAYLTVVSPTGVQTNDDDSGEGTNSQVRLTVDRAGMWEIWANTYESGQTGSYTLTVDRSTGATPPPPDASTTIGWGTHAVEHRSQVGQRLTFTCPAGGSLGTVWGTDVYTDDSSICTAAVHAGRISTASGGTVTIEMRAGQSSYAASARNGVTTRAYGSWSGSYVFVN